MIRFDLVGADVQLVADADDTEALLALVEQFSDLLAERDPADDATGARDSDPALLRLFPDPMPDDPAESAEIRELTRPALEDHKRRNAERVAQSLANPGALDGEDEIAWLQWLTDVRIVLASRLGILLDGDQGGSQTPAEQAMQWMYHALGSLQADLIDALDERTDPADQSERQRAE